MCSGSLAHILGIDLRNAKDCALHLSGGLRGGFRVIPFVFNKAKTEDGIASVDRFERRHPIAAAMTHARMN